MPVSVDPSAWLSTILRSLAEADRTGASPAVVDRDALRTSLTCVARLRSWCDAAEARLVASLAAVSSTPECDLATTTRTTLGEATRTTDRASTASAVPGLAASLEAGRVHGAHLDAVTQVARSLEPADRPALLERVEHLVGVAESSTAHEWRRRLTDEARRVRTDDGSSRLDRQRAAARARTRIDQRDGMWELHARFDPVTGLGIDHRIRTALDALRHDPAPPGAPSDPFERIEFLRAHALVELIGVDAMSAPRTGEPAGRSRAARPELVVVVHTSVDHAASHPTGRDSSDDPSARRPDTTMTSCPTDALDRRRSSPFAAAGADRGTSPPTADPASAAAPGTVASVDWGLAVDVPDSVLRELAHDADVSVVVLRGGIVVHAPGQLDLGRSTRLASRAQRRALRARHRTCVVPGCTVRFDDCEVHHVMWWRHGGRTDLSNLAPLCIRHHQRVHEHGWRLVADSRGGHRVVLPDGTEIRPPPRGP
jgi:hypothetical protein